QARNLGYKVTEVVGPAAINGIEQAKNLGNKVKKVAEPITTSVKDQASKHPYMTTAIVTAGGAGAGFFLGPPAVVLAVNAAGFTAEGIAAGSTGAALMSSYGGMVTSGSLCATLQSIGAAGTGLATTAFSAFSGAFFGYASSKPADTNETQVEQDEQKEKYD
ncbi:11050_t:CDS:2, partial [Ambispora leptoticha]